LDQLDIDELIYEFKNKQSLVNDLTIALKEELREIVTNKEIPLKQRSVLFFQSDLGEEETYLRRSSLLTSFVRNQDKRTYADTIQDVLFDCNRRHEVIYLSDEIDRIEEELESYEEYLDAHGEDEGYDPIYFDIEAFTDENGKTFDRESFDAYVEETLTDFVKSYTFDW